MSSATAILLPGFGGTARQPTLVALARRLEGEGVRAVRFAPRRGRPGPGLERELAQLAEVRRRHPGAQVLIGRSFGGRVCARSAALEPPAALVLLAFPIRPPGKRRLADEHALAGARCPVLVVQGARDELGPLRVVRAVARRNPRAEVVVIEGVGHGWGRREGAALDRVAQWVAATLRGRSRSAGRR